MCRASGPTGRAWVPSSASSATTRPISASSSCAATSSSPKATVNYTDALAAYGFETFEPDGDKTGAPDQGYDTDVYTAGEAVRWLRTQARR